MSNIMKKEVKELIANMKQKKYSPYLKNDDGMLCLKDEICPSCGKNQLFTFYHEVKVNIKICVCGYSVECDYRKKGKEFTYMDRNVINLSSASPNEQIQDENSFYEGVALGVPIGQIT